MNQVLLSLFCGAGGLDLGFEREGFQPGLSFDIRQHSVDTYNHNRTSKTGHVRDVKSLSVSTLDSIYGKPFTPIGVIGGPPCQSFSISNVHKKQDDPRDQLPLVYADLLKELNDRSPVSFFAFENVAGLLNKKFSDHFQEIKRRFEMAGFNIFTSTLDAVDYGVPQTRKRLIIVGLNKHLYPDRIWTPPPATHAHEDYATVEAAIGHLGDATHFARGLVANDIAGHVNHWCMAPKSEKFRTPGALSPTHQGRSFRTLEWAKPSRTIAFGNREVHIHPNQKRRLSVHEAALLQSFPSEYEFVGNLSNQFQQVSEAVPPLLAAQIAKSIREIIRL